MTISFQSLGLSDARIQHLEQLGFTEPTAIQAQAIPELLAGRDAVAQSQTGTGKTAAFALPMMERIDTNNPAVQALILTPTRELAQQVSQAIRDLSGDRYLQVLTIYGGQAIDQQIRRLNKGVQIVVGTPGRVMDLLNRGKLKFDQVRWAVLDEADEMLSMGFIDDVETILKQVPTERQTACFSATMPPAIRQLVKKFLRDPITVTVDQPKAAPSRIDQQIYMVPRGWTKAKALQPILELEKPDTAIIFVRTRASAAELTAQLQASGYSVDEYHGDLSQPARERLLHRFRKGQVKWIVATDIAARGLDVDQLSHVINYDLPDSVETYIHRIGRTGRAGNEGTAISLIQPMDRRKLQLIERRVRQTLEVRRIPSRAQVEARRLEDLQTQVKEALAGERMASFLPIVRELGEEYDPQAIAAAVLQMVYDRSRPAWMLTDWDVPEDRPSLPKPNKTVKRSDGQRRSKPIQPKQAHEYRGKELERR